MSYGTFRRPQVRSNEFPYGFNPEDPFTKYHNKLAQRTCFILMIAVFSGSYISVEQPRDSRLFRLHCYRQLLRLGCVISHFSFCSFGSAFHKHKPSKWLRNKPWLINLESECACRHKGGHFKTEGLFTLEGILAFEERCQPSAAAVYTEPPEVGQSVAAYSAAYPLPLVRGLALGSLAAQNGCVGIIPSEVRARSFAEVDEPVDNYAHFFCPQSLQNLENGLKIQSGSVKSLNFDSCSDSNLNHLVTSMLLRPEPLNPGSNLWLRVVLIPDLFGFWIPG